MVRFQNKTVSNDKLEESDYDSDLDINFITKLDDFDITNDDTDVRNHFQLDPSVWATPIKPVTPSRVPNMFQQQTESEMARKFPIQPPPGLSPSLAQQQTNALQQLIGATPQNAPPKIMSLEEIERNIINQQIQQKMMQEKLAAVQSKAKRAPTIPNQQQQPPVNVNGPFPHFMNGPPPPFPPHHLQGPPNLSKFNPLINITNQHPMNMNNFHPSFAGVLHGRPTQQQLPPGVPPMNRLPPHLIQGAPLMYQNSAQFNQRLVQEIQQNHPMLNPRAQQMRGDMMAGNNRNM